MTLDIREYNVIATEEGFVGFKDDMIKLYGDYVKQLVDDTIYEGIGEVAVYLAGFCLNMVRVVLFAKDNKAKRLKAMLTGLMYGLKFAPKVRHIKVSD